MAIEVLLKYFPLVKVDEKTHTVYGLATAEVPDYVNEICDYEDTAPEYKEWSDQALNSTVAAGQQASLGNIRLQHTMEIAGKVIQVDFKEDKKQIHILTTPASDKIWDLVQGGFVRGFSQGGSYKWRKCEVCKTRISLSDGNYCANCGKQVAVRYAATISEVSYVDNPALKIATFSYVKADGSMELRKFQAIGGEDVKDKGKQDQALKSGDKKTKRVAGEDLPSSAFAYVGDEAETSTWKFPLHFSSKEKSIRHTRNALSRWGEAKGIPDEAKAKVKAKIVAAAKKYGIDVADEAEKAQKLSGMFEDMLVKALNDSGLGEISKSLYDIGSLARILSDLRYLMTDWSWEAVYEEDDRDDILVVEMKAAIEHLVAILKDLVEEETAELTLTAKAVKGAGMSEEVFNKAKAASLAGHFRKTVAHFSKMSDCYKAKADSNDSMMEAHKAMADYHNMAAKAAVDDDAKSMHKSAKTFHSTMAGECKAMKAQQEAMGKSYASYSDHALAMADGYDMEEAEKGAKPGEEVKPVVEGKAGEGATVKTYTEDELKKAVDAAVVEAVAKAKGVTEPAKPAEVIPPVVTPVALTAEEVDAKVAKAVEAALAKQVIPPPKGFTLVPRGGSDEVAKGAGAGGDVAVLSDDDYGFGAAN